MKKRTQRALALMMALSLTLVLALTGCSNSTAPSNAKPGNSSSPSGNGSAGLEYPKNLVLCSGPIGGPWYSSATKTAGRNGLTYILRWPTAGSMWSKRIWIAGRSSTPATW